MKNLGTLKGTSEASFTNTIQKMKVIISETGDFIEEIDTLVNKMINLKRSRQKHAGNLTNLRIINKNQWRRNSGQRHRKYFQQNHRRIFS